jgi:rhodanese-related sulfurtransferase
MKSYDEILADALTRVKEILPWDLNDRLAHGPAPVLLDVREPAEFARLRIANAINVPRGVLEQACAWDYDETVPALAGDRSAEVVVLCRSGRRSLLAADTMQALGFVNVVSLKTGLRGWNDFELPLVDDAGEQADGDAAEVWLAPRLRADQRRPTPA